MANQYWPVEINGKKYWIIESKNSEGKRVWIKFIPDDSSTPIRVANLLDLPDQVSWRIRESHFETIDQDGNRYDYDGCDEGGSIRVSQGIHTFSKINEGSVCVFPLGEGVTMSVDGNTVNGDRFTIETNRDTWVGYATTRGSINPVNDN